MNHTRQFRLGTALVLLVFGFIQLYGSGIAPSAYQLIMQAGAGLARRSTVNFYGTGVTCVDNPGFLRTDCNVTGGVVPSGVYLFSATASATNAAAAEATIIGAGSGTLTLPANYFAAAGDTVMIHAAGHYSTPIAPGTLRIRLKVGAATVLDTGAWTPLPSITQAVWELNTRITARSVGVGGTVMAQGEFKPGVGIPVGQSWPMLNTAAVALDTTAANAMNLTAEWSAAGGETITGTNYVAYGVTTGSGVSTSGYATLQNATTPITQRATLNNGSGTYCVDNAVSGRSDCYVGLAVANEAGTGTTVNKLAKLTGAPSTAIVTSAGDTSGAVGVVVAGAGVAGSAVIATGGTVSCVFDGATTAGNYVQISATVAGDCDDVGATYPTSGQVIGRSLSTNGGAGTYSMVLFPPEVGAVAGTVVLITETVLAAPAASFSFAAIPGTYRDLTVRCELRGDNAAGAVSVVTRFNADAGNNYDVAIVSANNSVFQSTVVAQSSIAVNASTGSTAPANTAGQYELVASNYKGAFYRNGFLRYGVVTANATASTYTSHASWWWRNTNTITGITLAPSAGNFIAGSRCSLYGNY